MPIICFTDRLPIIKGTSHGHQGSRITGNSSVYVRDDQENINVDPHNWSIVNRIQQWPVYTS